MKIAVWNSNFTSTHIQFQIPHLRMEQSMWPTAAKRMAEHCEQLWNAMWNVMVGCGSGWDWGHTVNVWMSRPNGQRAVMPRPLRPSRPVPPHPATSCHPCKRVTGDLKISNFQEKGVAIWIRMSEGSSFPSSCPAPLHSILSIFNEEAVQHH